MIVLRQREFNLKNKRTLGSILQHTKDFFTNRNQFMRDRAAVQTRRSLNYVRALEDEVPAAIKDYNKEHYGWFTRVLNDGDSSSALEHAGTTRERLELAVKQLNAKKRGRTVPWEDRSRYREIAPWNTETDPYRMINLVSAGPSPGNYIPVYSGRPHRPGGTVRYTRDWRGIKY